jgi:methionyl-tRNA synthetase
MLHESLAAIWRTVARANEHVQLSAPWTLAKSPATRDALLHVLGVLGRALARQAVAIAPFMPSKAQALWETLGAPGSVHSVPWPTLAPIDAAGWIVAKGAALFPREEPPK